MTGDELDRRPRGRPYVGGRITLNLGDDLLDALDATAETQGVERSTLIRSILTAAMDAQWKTTTR